jgi:hypothetical protein
VLAKNTEHLASQNYSYGFNEGTWAARNLKHPKGRIQNACAHHYLSMALQPLWYLAAFSVSQLQTVRRTPWTADQSVLRPATAQNKRTNIHVSSGTRTHDPSVRASEDGSRLRPRGHCDRHIPNAEVYILSRVGCLRVTGFELDDWIC